MIDVEINGVDDPALNFFLLHTTDPFICDNEQFDYGQDALDGAILEPLGFKNQTSDRLVMQICTDCHSSLHNNKLPQFALANCLYQGILPDKFKDLMWIEEMVCTKYRNMAHITCIYQSSDPLQPKVFHGNMCAHDMNVVSTTSVLPHTRLISMVCSALSLLGRKNLNLNILAQCLKFANEKSGNFSSG